MNYIFDEHEAAQDLMQYNDLILDEVADAQILAHWTTYGVPSNAKSWEDLLPLEEAEYEEACTLARQLLREWDEIKNRDIELYCDEEEDNDLEMGFNPFLGGYDWDC